ncbi:hypothetical protein C9374_011714 [Naegleria lovaniensis]|uniref:Uncharacterized protein n=1 Tax=Naegleria lovaniensis TaxID=51637 RepID=A0AA88GFV0_NAELO|nr:uncharacterized protein C9374_011714 [Naegleria lovaniensis]KAG2373829.1 hypothetical protein C9374_011714 [Naegleria lovaniensis]
MSSCNSIQPNPSFHSSQCSLVENEQSDPRRALPEGIEMGKESMSGNCNINSDVNALLGFKDESMEEDSSMRGREDANGKTPQIDDSK